MVSTWNKIIISLTFCPNSNDFPHLSTWCIAWVLYTCCTHCALCTCGSLWVQCTCYTLLYALHVPDALSALHVLKSFVLCMCCTPWVLCTCCTICTLVCVFYFCTVLCQTKLQIDRISCQVDWGHGIMSRNFPVGQKFFEPWELIQKTLSSKLKY